MARYLVTGGAGFIGSNLVLALARAGERVRVVDDLSFGSWDNLDGTDPEQVERITGDVRDAELMARACAGVEVVFHEAAIGSVPISVEDPVRADSVNVGGTVAMLDAARHAGVRRVIFAASAAAYGDLPGLPKREDMPTAPLSPYAVSKLAAEQYLSVFASLYGMETLSLRYFNVFGPHQRPDGAYAAAIPRFAWAALTGEQLTVFGDGETTRDFCFIDNVVAANLAAAQSPRRLTGEVVNVATGTRVSLNQVVAELGSVLAKKLDVTHTDPRPGDVRNSVAAIDKARELLGYEPKVDWKQGLAPTVEYLRGLGAGS
jgi:UDP-glucose 4-epimerase